MSTFKRQTGSGWEHISLPVNIGMSPQTLGYAEATASQASITSTVNLTGLSVTVTVPAGRRIRISAGISFASSVASDTFNLHIVQDGAVIQTSGLLLSPVATVMASQEVSAVVSPSAGTHTYLLQAVRSNGTGSGTLIASASQPAYILVEDITGSTLPYQPASVPVGVIAHTSLSSSFATASTSYVDVPGMACNVVVPAGRTLKITINGNLYSTVNGDTILGQLHRNGVTLGEYIKDVDLESTLGDSFTAVAYDSPPAGANLYQVKIRRFSGSGSVGFTANPFGTLTVEDVSPTPAPSNGAPSSTLGYAEVVANQGSITTEVDLTGLSVTVTVPAGRRLRIRGQCRAQSTVTDDTFRLSIKEGGTALQLIDRIMRPANTDVSVFGDVVISPTAGSHTYKLTGARGNGTGTQTMSAGAIAPASILVEDITANSIALPSQDLIGAVSIFAGPAAPTGWLLCDGTSYATALYPNLFAVVGYTYGGSGANFNVPNLKGRVVVGRDPADADFDVLGETRGAKTHTLTTTEIPAHSHAVFTADNNYEIGLAVNGYATGANAPPMQRNSNVDKAVATNTGSGGAHNNLQPSIVLNYIIKAA